MKYIIFSFILFISDHLSAQDVINTDTIRISRLDTAFVMKMEGLTRAPCQKPRWVTYYRVKTSIPDAYYIIFDENNNIRREGNYVKGVAYDETTYYYSKLNRLLLMTFMEDGRHVRTEVLNRKGRPKKISYRDKKNGDVIKEEFYSNGKLKKVRNYYGFNSYRTTHH